MEVTSEDFNLESVIELFKKLGSQPIYYLIGAYVVTLTYIVIADTTFSVWYPFLFICILFLPILTVIYAERKWTDLTENSMHTQEYVNFKKCRTDFLFGGILLSVLYTFLSKIHEILLGRLFFLENDIYYSYSTFNGPFALNPRIFVIFSLIIVLSAIPVAYRFWKIPSGNQRLLSHPLTINSLMAYFLSGSYASFLILFPFQVKFLLPETGEVDQTTLNFTHFNTLAFGRTLQLQVIIPLLIVLSIVIHMRYTAIIQEIDKDRLSLLTVLGWALKIGILTGGTAYLLLLSYSPLLEENRVRVLLGSLVLGTGLLMTSIYRSGVKMIKCEICKLYQRSECYFHSKQNGKGEKSLFERKISPHRCPNCKEIWINTSRACQNCDFKYTLVCENCGKSVNPLWKKCNLCGKSRKSIVERALMLETNNGTERMASKYVIITLLSFPIFLTQLMVYLELIKIEDNYVNLLDDAKRVLMWILLLVAVSVLFIGIARGHNLVVEPLDGMVSLTYSTIWFTILVLTFFDQYAPFQFKMLSLLLMGMYLRRAFSNTRQYAPQGVQQVEVIQV
jgi:predicted RNA-binding Zn-ribbon protein involved in translation (DUF1610 family)